MQKTTHFAQLDAKWILRDFLGFRRHRRCTTGRELKIGTLRTKVAVYPSFAYPYARSMQALPSLILSPAAEWCALALGFSFGLLRLGHAYLELRRDWNAYQAERAKRLR